MTQTGHRCDRKHYHASSRQDEHPSERNHVRHDNTRALNDTSLLGFRTSARIRIKIQTPVIGKEVTQPVSVSV